MTVGALSTIARDDQLLEKRILIVDDHRSFAELLGGALDAIPGLRCVATASTVSEGVALVPVLKPNIVVMDIEMPNEDGLLGTRRIVEMAPGTVVAIITAYRDPQWVARAAQSGASAFIPKNGSLTEMIEILRRVRPGQMLVAPSTFNHGCVRKADPMAATRPELTQRELEVLTYLGQGMHAKGIGNVLGITLGTCRGYVKSLHRKLGVSTQLEAVIKAQQLGLIGFQDDS